MKARDIVTGEWSSWTYGRLQTEVTITSRALIETGLHRHHAVVIISNYNCPLWVISHFAAISAGYVTKYTHQVKRFCFCVNWIGQALFINVSDSSVFGRHLIQTRQSIDCILKETVPKMRPTKITSTHKYFVSLYGVIGLLLTLYLLSVTSLPPSGPWSPLIGWEQTVHASHWLLEWLEISGDLKLIDDN